MTPFLLLVLSVGADPAPLVIESPTVDLGERTASAPLVHTFRLKNTGAGPLTITEVTGVCGCVRQALGSRDLKPGDTTELTLGINLLTQPEGLNTWNLAVRYKAEGNPPATGSVVVRVAAKVKKDVTVEPVALMLSAEREITGALTVCDRRGKPLTVIGARVGLKGVTAEVRPATDGGGKRTQRVELTVTDACPPGPYADEVCIDTNDPEYKELRIPLRVVKKAQGTGVTPVPGSATVRFARDQATASALVRLRDAADREVVVEKAEADHPAVACKWAAGPGSMATLRVTVDLSAARAGGVGVVTVRLKGVADPLLIPVSWTVP